MLLDPKDDTTGYEGTPAVVGQLRLNKDGWFNYFGFPEQPMPASPFQFRHSGTDVKALTYGNLGTGGLSRATFEQTLPDDHPSGRFIPGFGTHFVEHRAIDPAGNYGMPESYRATVLPGSSPACTTTLTGNQTSVNVTTGVTCLNRRHRQRQRDGRRRRLAGGQGEHDRRRAERHRRRGRAAVRDDRQRGRAGAQLARKDVTIAGSTFNGGLALTGNTQVTANERYTRLAGAYGPILAGQHRPRRLTCADNSAAVKDFGATNRIFGSYSGCALAPVEGESPVGGTVPATLSLTLGAAAQFGAFTPGVARTTSPPLRRT